MISDPLLPPNPNQPNPIKSEIRKYPLFKFTKKQFIIFIIIFLLLSALVVGLALGLTLQSNDKHEFYKSLLFIDNNDLQLFTLEEVEAYGIKDFASNVQNIYAIKALNTTILLKNEKISLIQNGNESLSFRYNDSFYQIDYVNKNYSIELSQYRNFNISFPNISFNDADEEIEVEDPFTGAIITIKDSISQSKIAQAVVEVNYFDEGKGNRSVILPIMGQGDYFLSIPKNHAINPNITTLLSKFINDNRRTSNLIEANNDKRIENFKSSLQNQLSSVQNLLRKYPISDICSLAPAHSNLCNQLNHNLNEKIKPALNNVEKYASSIPVETKSMHKISGFSAKVKVPGEEEQEVELSDNFDPSNLVYRTYGVKTERGFCDDVTVAGNDFPDSRIINVGQSKGSIRLSYQTYTVKDQIDVYYESKLIFTTGCVGDSGTKKLEINGKETSVKIMVNPDCDGGSGTAWNYALQCQQNLLICKENSCSCYPNGNSIKVKEPEFDGCGSSKTQSAYTYNWVYSIGDEYGFTSSCNTHDICYGTCNSNQLTCDTDFCEGMKKKCEGNKKYKRCLAWAEIFCKAVKIMGGDAFSTAQKEHCMCTE